MEKKIKGKLNHEESIVFGRGGLVDVLGTRFFHTSCTCTNSFVVIRSDHLGIGRTDDEE